MDKLSAPDQDSRPGAGGIVPVDRMQRVIDRLHALAEKKSDQTAGYAPDPRPHPIHACSDQTCADPMESPRTGALLEYWRMLKRHRGNILVAASLGVLVAVLVTVPQTPVYRARTALEIQNINNEFLNAKQINPVSEAEDGGGSTLTDVQTQIRIVQSEELMNRVIDRYKAANRLGPLQSASTTADIRKMLNLPQIRPEDADYRVRQKAMKSLTVRQLGQTRVIELLFDSTDAAFSAGLLNDLTAAYIESSIDARWQMNQRTSELLARQLDDMRIKLEHSQDALEAYARKSGLLYAAAPNGSGTGDKTNVSEEKLRQLQAELSKAQADRASAQSRYEVAKASPPDTIADVLNDPSLQNLRSRLTELHREEADLIAIYTPKHEKVQRVQAQIQPIEVAFQRGRAAILDRIRNDFDAALARERLLMADYTSQAGVVTAQAGKSVQYSILQREVDSNQNLYEHMLQQVRESSLAAAIRASNIRVVDPARTPRKPHSPDYPLNCGLGLFSGLLLGIYVVVVRERADRTVQQPGDVQLWTNGVELGVIPNALLGSHRTAFDAASRTLVTGDSHNDGAPRAVPGQKDLMIWNNQPAAVADAFHATMTSIMFAGGMGGPPQLLVLTSGSPQEGKTTIVANLAVALAGTRRRVLVVDADLRKPRLHEFFDVPNDRGLSSLLQEEWLANGALNISPCKTCDELVHATSMPFLSVLPSGPPTDSAGNLLYSPVLAALFEKFRTEYDIILVDTPPMLGMSDARIAGRVADAVIFVARVGQTTREAVIAAHQRFAEDRTRIMGTILNGWNPATSPGGYYGYYLGSYYGGKRYRGYDGYYARK